MEKYIKLGKKLFPLCRSITGRGTLNTLKLLKKNLPPLKIKKIKSGTKVFDWIVPDEWNVSEAYIKDKKNKKIINFKNNNLHIFNYSMPIKIELKKNDILKKIYSLPKQPKAIPYVTSYYKKNWGFCETFNNKKKIIKNYKKEDKFKVCINSTFNKNGNMFYGELLIKGKSKKEILLSTYICHPSMANNELSGPLVTTALANYFLNQNRKPNYSIRIIYVPETIGSIAYISKNLKNLKKNVIGGYVLTCIGDNRNYSYLNTKYKNSIVDKSAREIFKKLNLKYKEYSFLERGSDERQFNSPGIDIPVGSIMRTKYNEYPEYHTSLDDFKLVNLKGLTGGFNIAKLIIENLLSKEELNFIKKKDKKKLNPICTVKCEPHLSKRNLYHQINYGQKNIYRKFLNFLQFADGTNSINEISKLTKLSLKHTKKIKKILLFKSLIK